MERTLIHAAQEAGEILLRAHPQITGQPSGVRIKENKSSIVTAADLESEQCCIDIIRRAFPEHNVLGEESGFDDRGSAYTWVIDPLDGTSNFAAGLPWFGVLLAVLEDGDPLAGAMYLPREGKMYAARKGAQAQCNNVPIKVSSESRLRNSLVSFALDCTAGEEQTAAESRLLAAVASRVRNVRMTNSLFDFCALAEGILGGCLNQHTKIWDIAAPCLVIEAAGGVFSEFSGARPDFAAGLSAPDCDYRIVAGNPVLHEKLLELTEAWRLELPGEEFSGCGGPAGSADLDRT